MALHLETLCDAHFEQLHALFDSVCREQRFLAFTQAGPREQTFAYYRGIVEHGHTHFVAVHDGKLVGWCDVLPHVGQMRSHSGVLGMAVAADARGKGIGKKLIHVALAGASARGLTRVELTVHSENTVAQALYKTAGFELEGIQRRGWCLNGKHFDVHFMARLE